LRRCVHSDGGYDAGDSEGCIEVSHIDLLFAVLKRGRSVVLWKRDQMIALKSQHFNLRQHETIRVPSVVSYAVPKPLNIQAFQASNIEAEVDVLVTQLG
jgi:hypothetical protein